VAADFRAFVDAQERVARAYQDRENWTRMSILNTAHSGKFSTDRTMEEYNAEIWKLTPVKPAVLGLPPGSGTAIVCRRTPAAGPVRNETIMKSRNFVFRDGFPLFRRGNRYQSEAETVRCGLFSFVGASCRG
jgi:hypothetical protein